MDGDWRGKGKRSGREAGEGGGDLRRGEGRRRGRRPPAGQVTLRIFVGCRKETNDEKGNNCKQYDTSFKYGLTLKYEKRASEKITRTRKVCEKDRRLSAACFIVYIPYREKQSILPSELQFADSCASILGSSETAP